MSELTPTFIVIGAPKCATTALYATLKRHPQVRMSRLKETRYFAFEGHPPAFCGPGGAEWNRRVIPDWGTYLGMFRGEGTNPPAIGEVSPVYLTSYFPERTAANIRRRLPEVRLIAVLRQPAERAYSNFTYLRGKGREPLADFRHALAQEPERKAAGWNPGFYYRENGAYATNLLPYYALFPRQQLHIVIFDDLVQHPARCLAEIYGFIGVDSAQGPTRLERENITRWPRSWMLQAWLDAPPRIVQHLPGRMRRSLLRRLKQWNAGQVKPPPLDAALRRELTESYRDEILRLQDLIGRNLNHWLKTP